MFNLNSSRKPGYNLNEALIDENINIYGYQVMYLFSKRMNEDQVLKDFSHYKIEPGVAQQITILPEDASNWAGEDMFSAFGFYNQQSTVAFISKKTLLSLYPDFLTETGNRAKILNSLLITPSGTILEITDIDKYNESVNNLWVYADDASSYKITMKVYDVNISDEGVSEIEETINLKEEEIFEHDEPIDTKDIDDFFTALDDIKVEQDEQGADISESGGPFGNLS
jgi:hypothetical protein